MENMENLALDPNEDIYFQCKNCFNTLTLLGQVESIMAITNERLLFILDENSFEEKAILIDKEDYMIADKSESDEDKILEDLLYCRVSCGVCKSSIGRYVLTAKENTQVLLNKTVLHSDSLAFLKASDTICKYVDLGEFLKIDVDTQQEQVKELQKLEGILGKAESDMNLLSEFQALEKYIDEGEEAMKRLIIAKNFLHSNYKA